MLVRLLPEQVSERWETLGPMIESSLPEAFRTPEASTNILRSIMLGKGDVWVYFQEEEAKAVVLTCPVNDPLTRGRYLLIYSLYAVRKLTKEIVLDGMETLMKHSREVGCGSMVAYTNIPQVKKLVSSLGGSVDYNVIEIEV